MQGRKTFDPRVREEAKRMYLDLDDRGRQKYSIPQISRELKKRFDPAPSPITIWRWVKADGWDALLEEKLLQRRADTLAEVNRVLGIDAETQEKTQKLEKAFSEASGWLLMKQLQLAKKMNAIAESISETHPRFSRIIEITDRVNQTAFSMLKDMGYVVTGSAVHEKPIIIINEIDGKRIVINQGGKSDESQG